MVIKLVLEQAKEMKKVVDAMLAISMDVALQISKDGFTAQSKDIAASWACDAFLDKSFFKVLEVSEPVVFHIDLKDFADFIKTSKSDDSLEIVNDEVENTLNLKLSSKNIVKELSLRLNDVDNFRFLKIMKKKFFSSCSMDSELFSDAIKAAELGDEHVTITHSREQMYLEARSTSRTAQATISYANNDKIQNLKFESGKYTSRTGEELQIPENQVATYSLKFLKHVAKLGKSGELIEISMSNDEPIRLVYILGDNQGYIGFAIAPRVRDEDAF